MNQLQCGQVRELLSAYVDNELDPVTALSVANHLERCAGCRSEFEQFSRLNRMFKGAAGLFVDIEPILTGRAKAINDQVRSKILTELASPGSLEIKPDEKLGDDFFRVGEPQPGASGKVVPLRRNGWRGRVQRLALGAALFLVTVFLGLIGMLYWAHYSGPLFAGTVRTHWVCSKLEQLGAYQTETGKTQALLATSHIQAPDLSAAGLRFQGAHRCRISKAGFIHLVYLGKQDQILSVFYGGPEAVTKLRENQGTVAPGATYGEQAGAVRVAAMCTTDQEHLWMVAGNVSETEMQTITASVCLAKAGK